MKSGQESATWNADMERLERLCDRAAEGLAFFFNVADVARHLAASVGDAETAAVLRRAADALEACDLPRARYLLARARELGA